MQRDGKSNQRKFLPISRILPARARGRAAPNAHDEGSEHAMLGVVTSTAVQGTATVLGMHITRRIAGAAAGRWIPLAGAAAVGAYAYWDTLQVAKATRRVLAGVDVPPALVERDAQALGS